MIGRVFRATPRPGSAEELGKLVEDVSIPFVDSKPGLLARFTGKGLCETGDELVMISVWESLDAMKGMTGEEWESEVIPDEREAELMQTCSVDHYESLEAGDADRVDRFLGALRALWLEFPDYRFGQLVMNLSRPADGGPDFLDPWNWDDGEWLARIADYRRKRAGT
jgi:antibiotic biosynthesis monooxygenase